MQTTLPAYEPTAVALNGHKLPCGCLQVTLQDSSGTTWVTVTPTYSIQRKMNKCKDPFPS